jgi:hypothetical protein
LQAFHNQQEIKDRYLARVRANQSAGKIVQAGVYYQSGDYRDYYYDAENRKGSAAGCTLERVLDENGLAVFEAVLGIPRALASLEDCIFAGSSRRWSKNWADRFLQAAPVGASLCSVFKQFAVWLLVDEKEGVIRHSKSMRSIDAIKAVAAACAKKKVAPSVWNNLAWSAYAAADFEQVNASNEEYEAAVNAERDLDEAAARASACMANSLSTLCAAELAHAAANLADCQEPDFKRVLSAGNKIDLAAAAASRHASQTAYVAASSKPAAFDLIYKAYFVANSYYSAFPSDAYLAAYAAARAVYESGGDDFEARAAAQAASIISDRQDTRAPFRSVVAAYAAFVAIHADEADVRVRHSFYEGQGEKLLELMSCAGRSSGSKTDC